MELWIDVASVFAHDQNEGTSDRPLRTINEGLRRAKPGDTIWVAPGIYRETVTPVTSGAPGSPIRIVSTVPRGAIIRGSEVLRSEVLSPGFHELDIPAGWVETYNPFALSLNGSRVGGTCGQAFYGEAMLREVGDLATVRRVPGTWFAVDNGTKIALHLPAEWAPGPVELSVRDRLFAPAERGMGHFEVLGFVFERCANQSAASFWEPTLRQCGAVGFRAGHHISFRGNIVRFAKTIGMDIGIEGGKDRGDGIVPHDNELIDNVLSDNGEVGACGQESHRTVIRGNLIERNCALSPCTVEEAGLKFHSFYDGLIEGNIIRDNEAAGIWLDAVWTGARIRRNLVVNNVASGIFVELGADGATVDHNIVAYTRLGDGIYTHDASDVLVAHNLVFGNSHFGIYMRYVSDRPFPYADGKDYPAGCARQRILNNVLIDNYRGHICLPADGERSHSNLSDHNHFLNGTQWQWEGQGFHRFCLGDNDGNLSRDVVDAQLVRAGLPAMNAERNGSLNQEGWRALGFDLNSWFPGAFRITSENGAVVKGTATLGSRDAFLELRLGPEAASPLVPALAECPDDFYGNARGEMTSPGPFASLKAGHHHFDLDPRHA